MLTFDEVKHEYKWDGIVVPSVTQIIGEWLELPQFNIYVNKNTGKTIPSDVMENAADFGTAIHRAIKLLINDNLDWDSLNESLKKPLQSFLRWWEQDRNSLKHIFSVFDFKTGNSDNVGPQLAGYIPLIQDNDLRGVGGQFKCEIPLYSGKYGYAGTPDLILNYKKSVIPRRYILKIPKNGDRCKAIEITGSNDWIYFKAKLTEYNYLKGVK